MRHRLRRPVRSNSTLVPNGVDLAQFRWRPTSVAVARRLYRLPGPVHPAIGAPPAAQEPRGSGAGAGRAVGSCLTGDRGYFDPRASTSRCRADRPPRSGTRSGWCRRGRIPCRLRSTGRPSVFAFLASGGIRHARARGEGERHTRRGQRHPACKQSHRPGRDIIRLTDGPLGLGNRGDAAGRSCWCARRWRLAAWQSRGRPLNAAALRNVLSAVATGC